MDEAHSALIVNDLHVASVTGLWPPDGRIEGGAVCEQNLAQQWTWRQWQTMLDEVRRLPQPPILVLNGDLLQGANRRDAALVSNNWAVQAAAGEKTLMPLVALCPKTYVLRGTEFHEGASSQFTERLAAALEAEPDPATGQHSRDQLWLNLGGHLIHVKHSVGTTSLQQTEAGVPTRDLLNAVLSLARWYGDKAPKLECIVRSHRHTGICVQVPPNLWAMVTPGWQWPGAFVSQRLPYQVPQFGYGLITVDAMGLHCRLRTFTPPAPQVEVAGD